MSPHFPTFEEEPSPGISRTRVPLILPVKFRDEETKSDETHSDPGRFPSSSHLGTGRVGREDSSWVLVREGSRGAHREGGRGGSVGGVRKGRTGRVEVGDEDGGSVSLERVMSLWTIAGVQSLVYNGRKRQ